MKFVWRAALLAATVMTPAMAQNTAPEPTPPGEEAPLEGNEIIVTARKFDERLQNVPTSVAVATAATIDRLGLDSLNDVAKTTAGLVFDDSFGRNSNRPVVRGQANILGQSGIAFFIDGIYYSGSLADYDVDTIERFEVVKGPQSALYGRNTYAGAINLVSKAPSDQLSAKISADISEHGRYDVTAAIRGPITDGLGFVVGNRIFYNKGEFRNQFDGTRLGKQETQSFYGMLRYDDGGPITASLRANYNITDDGQPTLFAQSANENNCFTDNGALYRGQRRYFCGVIQPRPLNSDYRRAFVDPENVGLEAKTFNAAFRVDFDLSNELTLTSLTGYNQRKESNKTDGEYTGNSFQTAILAYVPAGPVIGATPPRNTRFTAVAFQILDFNNSTFNRVRDWSQELRLSYQGEGFRLVAGGYYFKQSDDTRSTRVIPPGAQALAQANANAATAVLCAQLPTCGAFVPITVTAPGVSQTVLNEPRNTNNLDIRNIAVFGSAEVNLTDELKVSVEGRYAEERIEQATQTFNRLTAGVETVPPAPTIAPPQTFSEFTPRATVSYQVTPRNLIYGVYAEGQKPGGFNSNLAIVAGFPVFEPEDNRSFEIGFKNSFLGGRATFNLALYNNKITGYQITQNISVGSNQVSLTRNGGNARVKGIEVELGLRPSRWVSVTANYAYTDAKFTFGTDENQGVINDVVDDGLVNCSIGDQFPTVAGCQSLYGSIVGKRIPRAPQHTAFVDLDIRQPLGSSDWVAFVGGNVSMQSTSFDQVLNYAKTGGSEVVDIRFGAQNDTFKIQGYVKNLFDEDAVAQVLRFADANNDLRRNFVAGLRPGRRVGVVLSAGF